MNHWQLLAPCIQSIKTCRATIFEARPFRIPTQMYILSCQDKCLSNRSGNFVEYKKPNQFRCSKLWHKETNLIFCTHENLLIINQEFVLVRLKNIAAQCHIFYLSYFERYHGGSSGRLLGLLSTEKYPVPYFLSFLP